MTCPAGYAHYNDTLHVTNICRACTPGVEYQPVSAPLQCLPSTLCSAGSFQSVAPTLTADRKCAECPPGTYQPLTSATSCHACPAGTYSAAHGSKECIRASQECGTGLEEAAGPTPTSDIVCKNADACEYYPCSIDSLGCVDLPPPYPNNPFGRTCKPCRPGFSGDGSSCLPSAVYDSLTALCFCPPGNGSQRTVCGSSDENGCPGQAGKVVRHCSADNTWASPTNSCVPATSCADFPCPDNAICTDLMSGEPSAAGRACRCRVGYIMLNDSCVSLVLYQFVRESWTDYNANSNFGTMSQFRSGAAFSPLEVAHVNSILAYVADINSTFSQPPSVIVYYVQMVTSLIQTSQETINAATNFSQASLPDALTKFATNRAAQLNPSQSFVTNTNAFHLWISRPAKFTGVSNSFSTLQGLADTVVIPQTAYPLAPAATFSVLIYANSSLFIPHRAANVSTKVISVKIQGIADGQPLDEPVSFFFLKHFNASVHRCAYWDFTNASWLTDGCKENKTASNVTHVCCTCTHLTNFAVLASASGGASSPSISAANAKALELITYIGCSLSIFCMLLLLYVFLVRLPDLRTQSKAVICLLCFNLIGAQLTFLAGIDQTTPVAGCHVVALFLHFFLLAAFSFMLIEGYLMYRTFVIILTGGQVKWRYIYAVGFGIPIVIVAISAGIRWNDYGSSASCWLSTQNGTVWAFIGPMLAVVCINLIIFALVLRKVLDMGARVRRRSSVSAEENASYQKLKKALRASASFMCLLGITWVFGALAIGAAALAFYYLFALCNTLQGVFIFYFHCFLDPRSAAPSALMRHPHVLAASAAPSRDSRAASRQPSR